jgi:hypothetical protein
MHMRKIQQAWRPHADIAETRAVIDRFLAAWERQEGFCWLRFTSDAGEMIGSIAARTGWWI